MGRPSPSGVTLDLASHKILCPLGLPGGSPVASHLTHLQICLWLWPSSFTPAHFSLSKAFF